MRGREVLAQGRAALRAAAAASRGSAPRPCRSSRPRRSRRPSASAGSGATSSTGSAVRDYAQMAGGADPRRRPRPRGGPAPLARPAVRRVAGTHRAVSGVARTPAATTGPRRSPRYDPRSMPPLIPILSHRPCRAAQREGPNMKRTDPRRGRLLLAALALAACGGGSDPIAPAAARFDRRLTAAAGSVTVGSADFPEAAGARRDLRRGHRGQGHHGQRPSSTSAAARPTSRRSRRRDRHRPGVHRLAVDYFDKERQGRGARRGLRRAAEGDCRPGPFGARQVGRRGQELPRRHQGHREPVVAQGDPDLAAHQAELSIGAPPEFKTRQQGLVGLKSGLQHRANEFRPLQSQAAVEALKNGQVKAANIFSTDPSIVANGFVVLEDPKSLFGSDNVVPSCARTRRTRSRLRSTRSRPRSTRHPGRPGQAGRRRQEGRVGRGQGLPVEERPGLTEGVRSPGSCTSTSTSSSPPRDAPPPRAAGAPVVVGGDGDPTKRGVVSTASYEARALGVAPACRCARPPNVHRTPSSSPVDKPYYDAVSAEVMAALKQVEAQRYVVEVLGWDEAFVAADTDDPEALALRIQARCSTRAGWTAVSASGRTRCRPSWRPNSASRQASTASRRHLDDVWAPCRRTRCGASARKTAAKLAALGITTVDELAAADSRAARRSVRPHQRARGTAGSRVAATGHR